MKKLILTPLLLLITLASAHAMMKLPTGQFEYSRSEVSHVRHVQMLNLATVEGRETYERFKTEGYTCRMLPSEMARCYFFLDERGDIEIPLAEVLALAPNFGEEYRTEVLTRTNYVIIFDVSQTVEMPYGTVNHYRLHLKEGGDHFIEIYINGEEFYYRFGEENLNQLRLRRTYRKRTGDTSYLEYGVRSIYDKI